MRLRGFVATPDGSRLIEDEVTMRWSESLPDVMGRDLARRLADRGAKEILAELDLPS
jgi:porphobilinogen deaminase